MFFTMRFNYNSVLGRFGTFWVVLGLFWVSQAAQAWSMRDYVSVYVICKCERKNIEFLLFLSNAPTVRYMLVHCVM